MIAFQQLGQAHQEALMTHTSVVLTAVLTNHVLRDALARTHAP